MAERKDDEPAGTDPATPSAATRAPASRSTGAAAAASRRPAAKPAAPSALAAESFTFFETPPEWSIVIERGDFAPAALRAGKDIARQIEDIAGVRPEPVFDRAPFAANRRFWADDARAGAMFAASAPAEEDAFAGRFLSVPAQDAAEADALMKELAKGLGDAITDCLPVPPAEPAIAPRSWAQGGSAEGATPDFRARQGYMAPAPQGLGLLSSWAYPGGAGQGVTIIDLEGGWQLSHENLAAVRFSLWGGENMDTPGWREHGTAVSGLIAGSPDMFGITSVCPGARVGLYSVFEDRRTSRQRVANSVLRAGEMLAPGDILLIELQRPGPRTGYQPDPDQRGYLPIAYWPDIRAAIRAVVNRGVAVISVGGNGGVDLDGEDLGGRLDPAKNDSGAIHVGAGAPPGGQHGPARSRLDFSNYGSCIDVQAWGQDVVTSGYGDLWGIAGGDNAYTLRFMGTSAAAPLVCGVLACLQGRHKARYGLPIPPEALRNLLRAIGWRSEEADEDAWTVLQPDLNAYCRVLGLE
jgi:hypothetical protein